MIVINVNQQEFQVNVIYKRHNRHIFLRIRDGVVVITTPVKLTRTELEDFIKRNYNYIIKHMKQTPIVEDKIHYLGEIYSLKIEKASTNHVYVKEEEIVVSCKNPEAVPKLLDKLYTDTLTNVVERYSKDIFLKFQITWPVQFQYKNVKGYYGECFAKRNLIILSKRLAKYDLKYILSVIYHECAHFKYQNHQKEYYEYLEERYPNYRAVQKELRRIKYNEKY